MNPLLAFDTATERTYIAIEARGRIWTHEGAGGARASATFLPEVMALLEEARVRVAELDAVAFGRGPGAFTGLRTACAVAQGLAWGARKPVLPIDTLLAIAEDARDEVVDLRVWAVLDARMGELYAAEYAHDSTGWHSVAAPMLTTPDQLQQRWDECAPDVVAGEALAVFGSRLDAHGARRIETAAPRAAGLLKLGRAVQRRGGAVDAALALPLYLRDKVAETTAERARRVAA
jgi:tRNA threonylcarbamoyladenosine biosynthesis protein TsaB